MVGPQPKSTAHSRPDWYDDRERDRWMADYTLDRLSLNQNIQAIEDIQKIHGQLTLDSIEVMLDTLTGPGRTAIAFVGPKEHLR